jgi:hypothetical protein
MKQGSHRVSLNGIKINEPQPFLPSSPFDEMEDFIQLKQ